MNPEPSSKRAREAAANECVATGKRPRLENEADAERHSSPADVPAPSASADSSEKAKNEPAGADDSCSSRTIPLSEALERVCRHITGAKNAAKADKAIDIFIKMLDSITVDTAFDFLQALCAIAAENEKLHSDTFRECFIRLFKAAKSKSDVFKTLPGPAEQLFRALLLEGLYANELNTDDSFAFDKTLREIDNIITSLPPHPSTSEAGDSALHSALLDTLESLSQHYSSKVWARTNITHTFKKVAERRHLLHPEHRSKFDALNTSLTTKRAAAGVHISKVPAGLRGNFHPLLHVSAAKPPEPALSAHTAAP